MKNKKFSHFFKEKNVSLEFTSLISGAKIQTLFYVKMNVDVCSIEFHKFSILRKLEINTLVYFYKRLDYLRGT